MKFNVQLAKAFHRPAPVPEQSKRAAMSVINDGRMFRYSGSPEISEALILEQAFADYIGTKYALATNSCSSAILLSLIACGVGRNEPILMPAFTFTAVPSAIVHAGAKILPVECDENYRIDIGDFQKKAEFSRTKKFLLSYMRGYSSDIDAILDICAEFGITIIEDVAHALGGKWQGNLLGKFGKTACFSFQSNKIIDAGEGGMVVTNDDDVIARMIYLSGAYEKLPDKHFIKTESMTRYLDVLPLYNMRMTNLTAAIVLPQMGEIRKRAAGCRENYSYLKLRLADCTQLAFPKEDPREERVPDSLQFRLPGFSRREMEEFVGCVKQRYQLPLAWFGEQNNARAFWNWGYARYLPELPLTRSALETACDIRLPHSLTTEHLDYFADAVLEGIEVVRNPIIRSLATTTA